MKAGFLTEQNGKPSITRLLSVVVVLAGIVIGVVPAIMGHANSHTTSVALGFVGIGLGIKTVSKKIEVGNP